MLASDFLDILKENGIDVVTGVPDSTLKSLCDEINAGDRFKHYVAANEGAAVGVAMGTYLGTGKPACVYMQNSGEGNAINPLASLANKEVYGIPMLLLIGWRGEPGVHDEPQHVYQGQITCELMDLMGIKYSVVDRDYTTGDLDRILKVAKGEFEKGNQFALIIKKDALTKSCDFKWDNGFRMVREEALGKILKVLPRDVKIISTTGKISRELYDQSNALFGNHDNLFMTVGGMGHASMIAFGVATNRADLKIVCVDGDGAALMHMGSMAFLADNAPKNFYHIVINNNAHESVGGMPTGCMNVDFAAVAKTLGYKKTVKITSLDEIDVIGKDVSDALEGPILYEVMVSLGARADLSRPKESAADNKKSFMRNMNV
ncbi:phosphonopyruvate decarboxylase [Lachnospiraceae bacterium G11]|nr:phosphonopyruvate decarboxylase [Lachnospiraceae bacterium G11]